MQRGRGVVDQEDRLYLSGHNKAPKPCLWQAAGEEILVKIECARTRIGMESSIGI